MESEKTVTRAYRDQMSDKTTPDRIFQDISILTFKVEKGNMPNFMDPLGFTADLVKPVDWSSIGDLSAALRQETINQYTNLMNIYSQCQSEDDVTYVYDGVRNIVDRYRVKPSTFLLGRPFVATEEEKAEMERVADMCEQYDINFFTREALLDYEYLSVLGGRKGYAAVALYKGKYYGHMYGGVTPPMKMSPFPNTYRLRVDAPFRNEVQIYDDIAGRIYSEFLQYLTS